MRVFIPACLWFAIGLWSMWYNGVNWFTILCCLMVPWIMRHELFGYSPESEENKSNNSEDLD